MKARCSATATALSPGPGRLFSALLVGATALLLVASSPRTARADQVLDQSQTDSSWGSAAFGQFPPWGTITGVQPFTAGRTGKLTQVDLVADYYSYGSLPFLVQIQAVDGSGHPTGPVLGSGSSGSAGGWVSVPLTTPAPVTAGTSYAIVLTSDTGRFFFMGGSPGSGGYPDALQYFDWSDYWQDPGMVMAFRTYVASAYGVNALFAQSGSGKAYKLGSTIPIKLQLLDANGNNVSSAALVVQAQGLTQVAGGSADATVLNSGNSNPDSGFRYDATLPGYIFNLSTSNLSAGTWQLSFSVNGQTDPSYAVTFDVR